jgi:hypothetical protein
MNLERDTGRVHDGVGECEDSALGAGELRAVRDDGAEFSFRRRKPDGRLELLRLFAIFRFLDPEGLDEAHVLWSLLPRLYRQVVCRGGDETRGLPGRLRRGRPGRALGGV